MVKINDSTDVACIVVILYRGGFLIKGEGGDVVVDGRATG